MAKNNTIQEIANDFLKHKTEKTFNILIKRLRPGLQNFVFKYVNDKDMTNEILSNVFISIWEKHSQYKSEYNFSTWAYAIAKNESLVNLRSHKKLLSHEQLTENHSKLLKIYSPIVNMEMEIIGPASHDVIEILHQKTIEEIHNLSEPYRTVMIEREILQKQLKDISTSLDWNLSTVKTRLGKARKVIAEKIRKENPLLIESYNEI